ncbi:MAG: DUF192 domain-containing protein [Ardenticatenaceae bacterium]|nr:DUF192 domain-containing protein [Anaerolineales bacterium]MCB8920603.1 DUF192 domain-containing protein [Ardenticatenaceae bacterium]MCB8990227.1 DUF192 domain-containing protein [Ardenticatenaceae bacterium]MCB9002981.1 DUF192 domain-containing protein [Ardenticatenaceae bacterium]
MTTYCQIKAKNGHILIPYAKWCNTFSSKLRGFTFRRHLAPDEGLVLVENGDGRLNTSIHMLFVFFDLGVLWVNSQGMVVDSVVARPWRLSYAPQAPAQYVIEGHPDILTHVQIGDYIQFESD